MPRDKIVSKRRLAAALLAILCLVGAPVGASNRAYQSIQELTESTPSSWEGEYQTVRNETVSVNCPIAVPDVEAAPVLRVAWYPAFDPTFADAFISAAKSWSDSWSTFFENNWTAVVPSNLSVNDYEYIRTFTPLEEVDWDHAYCENNPLTPRGAFDALQEITEKNMYNMEAPDIIPCSLRMG